MRRTDRELPPPPTNDRPNRSWMCGALGDSHACDSGPDVFGNCPLRGVCQPKRTWHGKRNRMLLVGLFMIAVITAGLLLSPNQASWVKPGDLSTPHAQILSGTLESDRCITCHPTASSSPLAWFLSAGKGHESVNQTDRCLNCHHSLTTPALAKSAHHLAPAKRHAIRLASKVNQSRDWLNVNFRPSVDQDDVACSVCHKEHHGANADLTVISDANCQTCHAVKFGDFATSHPDWVDWPYGYGGEIAFNHATHANKHFSVSKVNGRSVAFQCASCHEQTPGNEISRARPYAESCAGCHDESLKVSASEGFDLIALPMLPSTLAAREANWPSRSTGFLDGSVPPLTELMLRSDHATIESIRKFPLRDFSQANIDNAVHIEAAAALARGTRMLLEDVASRGHEAILDRARGAEVKPETLNELLRSLPPQLVADTLSNWFKETEGDAQAASLNPASSPADDSDLALADPLLEPDPLLESDPLAPANSQSGGTALSREPAPFDPSSMLAVGGWYRDEVRLAIHYRGTGHDDPVIRSVVELIAMLPGSDPVRSRLLENKSIASCVECHPKAISPNPTWMTRPRIGRRDNLTRFSHAPHMNIAQLLDCSHCHQIASLNRDSSNPDASDPTGITATLTSLQGTTGAGSSQGLPVQSSQITSDFEFLHRSACIGCHTKQGAGDACTTCHRYHIHSPDAASTTKSNLHP